MFKKFLAAAAALSIFTAGIASAQQPLPPNIMGRNTLDGRNIHDSGMLAISRNVGLTAFAGGGQQAASYNLTWGMNQFTTVATAGDSATLPTYSLGLVIVVINAGANSMNIFPGTGGTINALGVNAAYALAAGKTVIFFQGANGAWYANLSA